MESYYIVFGLRVLFFLSSYTCFASGEVIGTLVVGGRTEYLMTLCVLPCFTPSDRWLRSSPESIDISMRAFFSPFSSAFSAFGV